MSVEDTYMIPLEELASVPGPSNQRPFSVSTHQTSTAGARTNNEYMSFRPLPVRPRRHRPQRWRLWIKRKHVFICVILILLSILAMGSVSIALLKGTADNYKAIEMQINGSESKLQQRLSALEEQIILLAHKMPPKDCTAIAVAGETNDGIYVIEINGTEIPVYCEFIGGDGWMVFQRRDTGQQTFYKGWTDYRNGFGNKKKEFWLGLETLHLLTSHASYKLLIELESWDNETSYAAYSSFLIGNSETNYQLNIGTYSGMAGDSLVYHNNRPFSTFDRDHDSFDRNCAKETYGAWWYGYCFKSNLNGKRCENVCSGSKYYGMSWLSWKNFESMKTTKMKMTRNYFPPN